MTKTDEVALDLASIPQHVREDIGLNLLRSFRRNIQDPEVRQQYRRLGEAFLKRAGKESEEAT